MHTHARAALAVSLLAVVAAGCQSARMPSLAFWNRPEDGSARIADAYERNQVEAPGSRIQQASYDRGSAESQRRQAITDALHQARTADARGQLDAARSHYQHVLELDPGHSDALHALGILADKQGDYRTAETHYLRALRAKPEDANLLSDMGYSYFLQGRRHDAEWYLREALKFDPQHTKARGNLDLLFDERKAFETYRQLLGDREATARMHALFPNAGGGIVRTAAATAAPATYGYDAAPHARGTQPLPQQQFSQSGAPAWPQQPSRATYHQPPAGASAMDHLRAEMERERAAALRQQSEMLTAPAVAADAFGQSPPRAGWPIEQQAARPGFGPSPAASPQPGFGFDPTRSPAHRSVHPQPFSGASAAGNTSPYGQWVEPPRGGGAYPSQAPPSGSTAPEPWPHTPGSAWGDPASQTRPSDAAGNPAAFTADAGYPANSGPYPNSFATNAPSPAPAHQADNFGSMSDVNRAAQRIGMEGGLFPTAGATAAQPAGHPAAGRVASAGTFADGGNAGAPAWNNPSAVQTVGAWQQQPTQHGAPGIVITPGSSSLNAPAAQSAAPTWPADRGWNTGAVPPQSSQGPYGAEQPGSWPQGSATPAGPQRQSGYGSPAATAPASGGEVPSYWQNTPGSGWNG